MPVAQVCTFQNVARRKFIFWRARCCHDVLAAAASPFGKSKNKLQEIEMKKSLLVLLSAALLGIGASSLTIRASDPHRTLVITMTNDPVENAIIVFDAATHQRLQTLSTNGKGGVGNNAGGVEQYNDRLLAAVNNGSGTVALFQRAADHLVLEQLVVTTSPPVSVTFANRHMYVAGATSVDSFVMDGNHVGNHDGTTALILAGGGLPDIGNTSQIQAADDHTLLVTLKTDPIPGTVDVIHLSDGAIREEAKPVSAPAGTLAPFGFSVYPVGTLAATALSTKTLLPVPSTRVMVLLPVFTTKTYFPTRVVQQFPAWFALVAIDRNAPSRTNALFPECARVMSAVPSG